MSKSDSEVTQIVQWLRGLERRLQQMIPSNPDLAPRRGLYDGIADDIESRWPQPGSHGAS
jgi:hypothetical protein